MKKKVIHYGMNGMTMCEKNVDDENRMTDTFKELTCKECARQIQFIHLAQQIEVKESENNGQ